MSQETVSWTAGDQGQSPQSITAIVKARDEEENIGDCIESVRDLVDEVVVVVDSRSRDSTDRIAFDYGAVLISPRRPPANIDELDGLGVQAASSEWILRIDADERVQPSLAVELRWLASMPDVAGVRFARMNIMCGQWLRHGGWFRADQLRFFRKSALDLSDPRWTKVPHIQPPVLGRIITLPLKKEYSTVHFDYSKVSEVVTRGLAGYALVEAGGRRLEGQTFSLLRVMVRPLKRFIGCYFYHQGFRDGYLGFVFAVLLAMYEAVIELSLWDSDR